MITSIGKQSDKEVETLYVGHRGTAEVKISLPSPSLANPRTAPGPKHLQVFFSFKCTNALWSGKENVILTRGPFGQSL